MSALRRSRKEGIAAAVDADARVFVRQFPDARPAFRAHDISGSSTAAQDGEAEDRTVSAADSRTDIQQLQIYVADLLARVKTIPRDCGCGFKL